MKNPEVPKNSEAKRTKNLSIRCCQWNIKRGLICRENEIINILKEENVDIMFLTETDSKTIKKDTDFQIAGYDTVLPLIEKDNDNIRIIALVSQKIRNKVKTRSDLMSDAIPSIWLEVKENVNKITLVSGFYREWSHGGNNSEESQIQRINIFTEQIEKASTNKNTDILIMGDLNLDALKWNEPKFVNKNVALILRSMLTSCGLEIQDIGATYMADHVQANQEISQSALDHV